MYFLQLATAIRVAPVSHIDCRGADAAHVRMVSMVPDRLRTPSQTLYPVLQRTQERTNALHPRARLENSHSLNVWYCTELFTECLKILTEFNIEN